MSPHFQLLPDQASSVSSRVDNIVLFMLAVSAFFILVIFAAIVYLALKYRRRSDDERPSETHTNYRLEATWIGIPFVLVMVMFFWGAKLYVHFASPPSNAMQINVVGKQWMWKLQHPTGRREINTLHVPLGRPIRLVMTSQDVIHDFAIPAFRIKQDVVPGRYLEEWFTPTQLGEFRLYCNQYCGGFHSRMVGEVYVMTPAQYDAWTTGVPPDDVPAVAGEKLFNQYECSKCHSQRGPSMAGLYGSRVLLDDGRSVVADDNYLRESIVEPHAKIVAGYGAEMPTFKGQLSEEQIFDLIAYIKSLKDQPRTGSTEPTTQRSAP